MWNCDLSAGAERPRRVADGRPGSVLGFAQGDRRAVVNREQARALLAEVGRTVPELEAFFGCLYYAALGPE